MEEVSKTNDDIEEGECSDQDDEPGMSETVTVNSNFMKQPPLNYSTVDRTTNVYRQGCIPQIIINSDQSDQDDSDDYDDDDDEYPSHGKKTRRYGDVNVPYVAPVTFVNPLRSQGMMESLAEGSITKRRNNVWGAVMTEQILSQDIKQFGVNAPFAGGYRDVESYDFTIAKEDDRPEVDIKTDSNEREDIFGDVVDLEREVKKHQNRKRKRNMKERLGQRIVHENIKLENLNVTENHDVSTVTQAIIDGLGEQNVTLFTRIVEAIGNETALQLYNKTMDVENVGGMMINSGNRRRTPGGVYIQLLKTESSIPESVISAVFEQEEEKWQDRKKEMRNIKKAARKKWKKKPKRFDMDYDRPETPTPTKELEELDNGNEVDVDVSDLPDRPDTPEPKDSSDESGEEEDEEEDDIAVAIAKAKAAILRKQKQMVESKIDEDESHEAAVDEESVEMS